jgi:hypothetical protein
MAEPTAFPKPREANDAGYQQISGFAIAGLVVGVVFVGFLLLQVVMGMLSHSVVLMPLWLEFFAALGAGLSALGIRYIRSSGGTLAGIRIAKTGLWLSLVAGLGYGSYYGATYLAVRQQANTFVLEWFDKMRKGKINQAFLMTQPPGVVREVNPDDDTYMNMRFNAPQAGPKGESPKAGPLDMFRHNEIIQAMKQGGDLTKVKPLGVRSWERKEGTYSVKRVYGVETPEGTFELQVSARGMDRTDAAEKGRGWFVPFNELSVEKDTYKKTKLGQRLEALRLNGQTKFLAEWGEKVVAGKMQAAYLDTLDPKDRQAASADKTPPFSKPGFLDFSHYKSEDKTAQAAMDVALKDMLAPKKDSTMTVVAYVARGNCNRRDWHLDAEQRVVIPLDCQILGGPRGAMAKYYADGVAWIQSEPGQLENETSPHWRLLKIELLSAADVAEFQKTSGRQGATVQVNQ